MPTVRRSGGRGKKEQFPETANPGKYLVRKMKGRENFQKGSIRLSNAEEPTDNYD